MARKLRGCPVVSFHGEARGVCAYGSIFQRYQNGLSVPDPSLLVHTASASSAFV